MFTRKEASVGGEMEDRTERQMGASAVRESRSRAGCLGRAGRKGRQRRNEQTKEGKKNKKERCVERKEERMDE